MTCAVIQKVCGSCGQDCANRPRTKDRRGRYFCSTCYDRAIARQRQLRGTAAPPTLSPKQSPPTQPIDGPTTQAADQSPQATANPPPAPPSPPLLPSHAALLLPPAPAPEATPNGELEPAHAALRIVEDRSPPATFNEPPSFVESPATAEAAKQPFEPKEAPDIDAEPPAATIADVHDLESPGHDTAPTLSRELPSDNSVAIITPTREASLDHTAPAPPSPSTEFHVPGPELESEAEAAPAETMPTSREAPSMQPPSTVLPLALEPEPAEPSVFELEPEEQPEWLAGDEIAPSAEEQDAADTFEASAAPSSGRPATPSVVIVPATQAPRAPLPLRERRQAALDAGPLPAAFAACPNCGRPMPTGAVICLACGLNTMSGVRSEDDVHRPLIRRRARSGWTGPALLGATLVLMSLAGGYLTVNTRTGVLAYGIALLISVPAWFAWALLDARDTEGAQLKIWLVPGYIFAWVFGESRSRYLRAATLALLVIAVVFAALGYQWQQHERQRTRAGTDQRAGTAMSN